MHDVSGGFVFQRGKFSIKFSNLLVLVDSCGQRVESPEIECCGTRWVVQLYPKGCDQRSPQSVGCFVRCVDNHSFAFELTAFHVDGKQCIDSFKQDHVGKGSQGTQKLFDRGAHLRVGDDSIKLCVSVSVYIKGPPSPNPPPAKRTTLSSELRMLYEKQENTDIVLTVVNDSCAAKSFQAHKFVLALRSPVFKTMFESSMREAIAQEIQIEDSSADAIEEMLYYCYNDVVRKGKLPTLAQELLCLACKYQLSGLKALCEEFFCGSITEENAVALLHMAKAFEGKQLHSKALNFIAANVMRQDGEANSTPAIIASLSDADCREILSIVVSKK